MKKVYQTPEMEEVIIEYSGVLAASNIQGSTTTTISSYEDEDDIDL